MRSSAGITRRDLLRALPLLPAARYLAAQEQQKPSFSTDVKVVNLFATVRDKKDQIVRNLTKDDSSWRRTAARRPSGTSRRRAICR